MLQADTLRFAVPKTPCTHLLLQVAGPTCSSLRTAGYPTQLVCLCLQRCHLPLQLQLTLPPRLHLRLEHLRKQHQTHRFSHERKGGLLAAYDNCIRRNFSTTASFKRAPLHTLVVQALWFAHT